MNPIKNAGIKTALAGVPAWRKTGKVIRCTREFPDFKAAMKFVNAVARAAEKAQHHPDVDIRWNRVTLSLTTHDAGGLTSRDFELARRFDGIAG
jgi:4a-hydroxytetrahydrobiopterin dehydratase